MSTSGITELLEEANRQAAVCNGCRYCEGYCAVFPAMERFTELREGDFTYLANLCHDCRACFQACMYTPPHEFQIHIPALMSQARYLSYEHYAKPRWLASAIRRGPLSLLWLTLAGITLYVLLAWLAGDVANLGHPVTGRRSFYHIVPFALMLVPALIASAFMLGAIGWGLVAFWRDMTGPKVGVRATLKALRDAVTLRQLAGGGGNCYFPDPDRPEGTRRLLHHLVAYGFLTAFAATVLAAVYQDILAEPPPYPIVHPVVLLGIVGGAGLIVGSTWLLVLRVHETPLYATRETLLNSLFLISLDAVATTGLLLLILRSTSAMGTLLVFHLGTIATLFLTAPYGKAVHIVYRSAALLRNAAEQTTPVPMEPVGREAGQVWRDGSDAEIYTERAHGEQL